MESRRRFSVGGSIKIHRGNKWSIALISSLKIIRLALTFFYLVTLSFRLAFRVHVTFETRLWDVLLKDYVVDLFFWVDFAWYCYEKRKNDQVSPSPSSSPGIEMSRLMRKNESSLSSNSILPDEYSDGNLSSKGAQLLRSVSTCSEGETYNDSGGSDDFFSQMERSQKEEEMLVLMKQRSVSRTQLEEFVFMMSEFIMLFPFEVIGFVLGYKYYYYLKYIRILRLLRLPSYVSDFSRLLIEADLVTGASARRVIYLTAFMILFAHIGACSFYALSLSLIEDGIDDVWLTYDGIVEFSDGSYIFTRRLGYRYARALYWAVVTSQTVGFGDVRPRAVQETTFCLFFFYISHFLCGQLAIGNLLLLFDVYDSARTQYKDQLQRLEKYAQFRKLPTELKDRISCFYYHQWKDLQGLDESQILEEIPDNMKIKVKQATVRSHLSRVPFLKNLKIVVLNALASDAKLVIFSPSDVIVAAESQSTGMYVIVHGEAFVSIFQAADVPHNTAGSVTSAEDCSGSDELPKPRSSKNSTKSDVAVTQTLRKGDAFGVNGLTTGFMHSASLIAGSTVCEVLYLSRIRFQRTIGILMSEEECRPYRKKSPVFTEASKTATGRVKKSQNYNRSISHTRSSAVINCENNTIPSYLLRLKADGDLRTSWDVCIFLGILFYSVTIPINLSHSYKHSLFSEYVVLFCIGFVIDLFFFVDLILRMFVFPEFDKSLLVTSPKKIFALYRERHSLVLEALSVFPFDIFGALNPNLLPILRTFKIFHLTKFEAYGSKAERMITRYFQFTLSFNTSRFIRLQLGLFELCHWAACLWQLVAEYSTNTVHYDTNWKIQDEESEFLSIQYSSTLDKFTAYIRSIYWAINALSTSGVADMPSTNMTEMVFVCFALLCGCQLINALLGSIASMMGNMNKNKRDFESKMNTIVKYMEFKKLPVRLKLKIQFFFEYSFSRSSGVDEMKLLAGLPQPLREDVVSFVVGSVLIRIPFFMDCSEPMLEMILGLLKRRCFLNQDVVVTAGEFGKEFFIIESGSILITSKDQEVVFASLKHGDYIGESCLLKVVRRTASAHARDYSETYVLEKEEFENVVEMFPEDGEEVKRRINEHIAELTRENERQRRSSRRSLLSTFKRLESIKSLDTKGMSAWDAFLEEFSYYHKLWLCLLLFILLYNFFMIPLRLAFKKDSFFEYYIIDYALDIVLWVDMYLKGNKFRKIIAGKKIMQRDNIWSRYKATELMRDIVARFPYDLLALVFIGDFAGSSPIFVLAFLRIPRVLLLLGASDLLAAAESVFEQAKMSFFALRMLQVLAACLMVGHWLGCGLYALSKVHLGDFCVNEPGALYGLACQYRDTWVQFQIYTSKLPDDGGTGFARYLRCINWAIPTMVLYTVGDVYPMNVNETSYIFAAMFLGIPINAMIVGTIISLVTQVDDQSADILMKSDTLREKLRESHAPEEVIKKVSDYIKFLVSTEGSLVAKEDEIFEELPHSLQVMLSSHLKEKYIKNSPFFDFFPDEAIRDLCLCMKQRLFYIGDYVVSIGDMGHEMFFIASGSCEVVSWDKKTVLAKLHKDASVGEVAFFGLSDHLNSFINLENIRAISMCICYVLKKSHFQSILKSYEIDFNIIREKLSDLRDANCRRHTALLKNIKTMENPKSKLSRVLGQVSSKGKKKTWVSYVSQDSLFVLIVDVLGYLFMLYYAFVIPYEIAFLHGEISEYRELLMVDFSVDFLCALEFALRLFVFFLPNEGIQMFEVRSSRLYKTKTDILLDVLSILPLELFALLSGLDATSIFFFRAIHLLRLLKLFVRTERMEHRMVQLGISLHFTTLAVFRGILAYAFANHWMACLYFSLHRYIERGVGNTWVVMDGYATYDKETHRHDICNMSTIRCYQRAVYFVGTLLTSVGYGDIAPITDDEIMFQIFLAIVGACMGANICGQLSSYLKLSDRTGEMAFKEKIKSIEHYCSHRCLSPDLRLSLIANYHIMWNKERRVGTKSTSFLHALPTGMMGEVALALNKQVIETVPLFQACRTSLHPRMANALKPQVSLPNSSIYSVGDIGSSFFLLFSGKVRVTAAQLEKNADEIAKSCHEILQHKHNFLRNVHLVGHHFGESALCSRLGIRRERAIAIQVSETYALNKEDIWAVFQFMPDTERYLFLKSMFTTVGGNTFLPRSKRSHDLSQMTNMSFSSLFELTEFVIKNIMQEEDRTLLRKFSCEDDQEYEEGKDSIRAPSET